MQPQQESPSECLIRIQNEISEVEKREMELRNEHAMTSPRSSAANVFEDERSTSPQNICTKDVFRKNKIIEPQPKPQLLAPPGLQYKKVPKKLRLNTFFCSSYTSSFTASTLSHVSS